MIGWQGNVSQLTIVPDRSEGGTSLKSGEIQLMLHRRTDGDDNRGVEQPVAETMCGGQIYFSECAPLIVRGTHLVSLQVREVTLMDVGGFEHCFPIYHPSGDVDSTLGLSFLCKCRHSQVVKSWGPGFESLVHSTVTCFGSPRAGFLSA